MNATVLTPTSTKLVSDAAVSGGDLWLPLAALAGATGWDLKPEGACQGERCVPIPRGREPEFVADGRFNLSALARYIGLPMVNDAGTATWAAGEAAEFRSAALRSLQAPDFTLPDLAGTAHSLSDYRGRKVFLASWASW
jgi:AhpC/TSA family